MGSRGTRFAHEAEELLQFSGRTGASHATHLPASLPVLLLLSFHRCFSRIALCPPLHRIAAYGTWQALAARTHRSHSYTPQRPSRRAQGGKAGVGLRMSTQLLTHYTLLLCALTLTTHLLGPKTHCHCIQGYKAGTHALVWPNLYMLPPHTGCCRTAQSTPFLFCLHTRRTDCRRAQGREAGAHDGRARALASHTLCTIALHMHTQQPTHRTRPSADCRRAQG